MLKIVHAADLHLDSPLRGLERYEGAPVSRIRGSTRRALEALVTLCIEEEASLLLLAGDLYDGDWRDYATGLFFAAQMSRLREAGVPVVLLRGNHDAASQITKHLALPDNCRELSTKEPETIELPELGVAIHGQGFATRAVYDDLAAGYPSPIPGALNVALLHSCLEGFTGHEPYAPSRLSTLIDRGYDYWALGHIHTRAELHRDPWVVYPGNLQGRHGRETGEKGATVLTIDGARIVEVEHRALDVVRWETIPIDATAHEHPDDVVDAARAELDDRVAELDGRLLAARLSLEGRSAAHVAFIEDRERWEAALRAVANDVDGVWLERIDVRTEAPIDLADLQNRDDAIGQLVRRLAVLRGDPDELGALAEELSDLQKKLPREARTGADGLTLDDPALLREILDEVEQLLVPRLVASRSDR